MFERRCGNSNFGIRRGEKEQTYQSNVISNEEEVMIEVEGECGKRICDVAIDVTKGRLVMSKCKGEKPLKGENEERERIPLRLEDSR